MSVQGLDDLGKPLDPVPLLQRAAERLQRRTYEDLREGNFDTSAPNPTGADIRHNAKYTIRRKGFDQPGFGKTGEMSLGLVDPANVRIDGNQVALDLLPPSGQEAKYAIFTRGQTQPRRVVVLTGKNGKPKKRVEKEVIVPGRDFAQWHDEDLEAIGEDLLGDVPGQWGFRET